jgi:hypothetical protein
MNSTQSTRPGGAPAYYLGRPADVWHTALRRRRRRGHDASRTTQTTRDRRVASHPGARP